MKKLTLEQRIARLENLLNNKKSVKNESFESDLDEAGARAAADAMAKRFMAQTGHKIYLMRGYPIVSSPMYGWLDSGDEIEDDDLDARFVFTYEFDEDPEVTASMIPSDGTVQVFENSSGTALDPTTGEWFEADTPQDGAFPLSAWKVVDLSMDEYEGLKRNRHSRRCESNQFGTKKHFRNERFLSRKSR